MRIASTPYLNVNKSYRSLCSFHPQFFAQLRKFAMIILPTLVGEIVVRIPSC